MSEKCELCELDRINHVFYNCDDFIIIACDSCNVPMVVPYRHIDPTKYEMLSRSEKDRRRNLMGRMRHELNKVAQEFYGEENFYIDTKENKIPNHMHWHARVSKGAPCCTGRHNKIKIKGIKR